VVGVGDCDGECVGGVGAGDRYAGQEALDHRVDLDLVGVAGADHGLLDQPRGIFLDFKAGAGGDHQGDSAGLGELQGGLRVLVDENLLDRSAGRGVLGEQGLELAGEVRQARRQRLGRIGPELAVGDVAEAVAVGAEQTPAGRAEPGIEAEDQGQASFSSSSSGTS
jgi:hypothetical protein